VFLKDGVLRTTAAAIPRHSVPCGDAMLAERMSPAKPLFAGSIPARASGNQPLSSTPLSAARQSGESGEKERRRELWTPAAVCSSAGNVHESTFAEARLL
jgi:hypothetical protein